MAKLLLSALLALAPASALLAADEWEYLCRPGDASRTLVLFGNGIEASPEEAQANAMTLKGRVLKRYRELEASGAMTAAEVAEATGRLEFCAAYATTGDSALKGRWKASDPTLTRADFLDDADLRDDLAKHVRSYGAWLGEGRSIILVAHSNGNYIANAAYDEVGAGGGAENFHVIAVGTPDDHVAGLGSGGRVTLHGDMATAVAGALDGNYVNNAPACQSGTAPTEACHDFIGAYLDGDVTGPAIIDMIVYYVQATAPDSGSPVEIDEAAPATPAGLAATAASAAQLDLVWTAAADDVGVTGYKLYRDGALLAVLPGLSHSDAGLGEYERHCYEVSAVDAAGNESAASAQVCARTLDVTAPAAPGSPATTVAGASQIDLSWTASTDNAGVAGYNIYRNGAFLRTSATPSVSDTGLAEYTQYTYEVSAVDAAGNESAKSAVVTVRTLDVTAPTVPGSPAATAASEAQLDLVWTASTDNAGVAGYNIYRDGAFLRTSATLSVSDTGLAEHTQYCYEVSAVDAAGNESAKSAPVCATTLDVTAPTAPGGLTATAASQTQIDFAWTAASTDNDAVADYKVYRDGTLVATLPAPPFSESLTGLSANETHCYKVVASDAAGNEGVAQACATTLPVPMKWTQLTPALPYLGSGSLWVLGETGIVIYEIGGTIYEAGGKAVLNAVGLNGARGWEWDGAEWKAKWRNVGAAPSSGVMAYDAVAQEAVLFYGLTPYDWRPLGYEGYYSEGANETWTWDGSTWTKREPSNAPPKRGGAMMAYDANPLRQETVLFLPETTVTDYTDYSSTTHPAETWVWDGADWAQKHPTTDPGTSQGTMFYDTGSGKVTLVIANSGSGIFGMWDIWQWDGDDWTQLPSASPGPLIGVSMNYSITYANGKVMLFGGYYTSVVGSAVDDGSGGWSCTTGVVDTAWWGITPSPNCIQYIDTADTWELDIATATWTLVSSPATVARSGGKLFYDPESGKVVLYGGYVHDDPDSSTTTAIYDSWAWDGTSWTVIMADGTYPTPRTDAVIAYDPIRQEMILWGGRVDDGSFWGKVANDTWSWDGTSWTKKTPPVSPRATGQTSALVWDDARGELVGFSSYTDGEVSSSSDTWVWNGTNWSDKDPAHKPPARYNFQIAYDAERQQVVLFGGYADGAYLTDTWVWDGTDWTELTPAHHPEGRVESTLTYDAERKQVVLFGGYAYGVYFNDTWVWDGTDWTEVSPEHAPPPTAVHSAAWDPVRKQVVMTGGSTSSGYTSATWVWNGTDWTELSMATTPPSGRGWDNLVYDAQNGQLLFFDEEAVYGFSNNGIWALEPAP
jgi:chitodextrinase